MIEIHSLARTLVGSAMKLVSSARVGRARELLLRWGRSATCGWLVLQLTGPRVVSKELRRFRPQVISKSVNFGYQLVAADFNGDGKPDIACIGASTVKLYEKLGR